MPQFEPLLSRLSSTTFTERSPARAPLPPPPYVIGGGGGAGAGGEHHSQRTSNTGNGKASIGGQHRAPIGTSTKDITDAEDMAQRLEAFNHELELVTHPRQSIGDWWARAERSYFGAACGWEW